MLPILLVDCKSPLDIKVHIYASWENTSFRISSVNKFTKFVKVVRPALVFSKIIIKLLYKTLYIFSLPSSSHQELEHHDQENALKVVEKVGE